MGKETILTSFVAKCSCQTMVEMAMVKAKKAITRKAHKAKNLAKLVAMAELGSTMKLPKTPKGEKEKTSKPLNLGRSFLGHQKVKRKKPPSPLTWKVGKNGHQRSVPIATTPISGRTRISPYDSGRWNRGRCNQLTLLLVMEK